MRTRPFLHLVFIAVLAALSTLALPVGPPPAEQSAGATAASPVVKPADRIKTTGLPNLGRMSGKLYRGGQPEEEGFAELKKLGIEIVVNFRNDAHKGERASVETLGMKYIEIPWSGFDHPKNNDVAQFLEMLRDNSGQKVFFHCRRGAERTGVMGAAYRMAYEHWSPEQALAEMEQFKFRGLLFRHLKKYVRSFPQQLESDPVLQPFRQR